MADDYEDEDEGAVSGGACKGELKGLGACGRDTVVCGVLLGNLARAHEGRSGKASIGIGGKRTSS